MRIMGVDPGLKATGYGVIEVVGRGRIVPIDVGTIEPSANLSLPDKLTKIYQFLHEIIARERPEIVVVEQLYAHQTRPMTASIMGHARGVICLVAAQAKCDFFEYSVKRVRKAVLGNGNATKEQTRCVVSQVLNIKAEKLSLDASDALALALAHASMTRLG